MFLSTVDRNSRYESISTVLLLCHMGSRNTITGDNEVLVGNISIVYEFALGRGGILFTITR